MNGFVEKYKKRLSSMKQPLFAKNEQFRRNFSMIYFEKFLRINPPLIFDFELSII
jgi:hypothetical protein